MARTPTNSVLRCSPGISSATESIRNIANASAVMAALHIAGIHVLHLLSIDFSLEIAVSAWFVVLLATLFVAYALVVPDALTKHEKTVLEKREEERFHQESLAQQQQEQPPEGELREDNEHHDQEQHPDQADQAPPPQEGADGAQVDGRPPEEVPQDGASPEAQPTQAEGDAPPIPDDQHEMPPPPPPSVPEVPVMHKSKAGLAAGGAVFVV